MSIDYHGPLCGCGKPGCIEILAAGPAIARRARTKLTRESRAPIILDLAKGNTDAVTSEIVGQAYAAGDPLAKEVLQETVDLLSLWLSNIIDLLEPDVIIHRGWCRGHAHYIVRRYRQRNCEILHHFTLPGDSTAESALR